MLNIHVIFLGPATDFTRCQSAQLEVPDGTTADDFKKIVGKEYPAIEGLMPSVRLAVNEEFAVADQVLRDGDEVAVIPPVSGGEQDEPIWAALIDSPLSFDQASAFVSSDISVGAVVSFEGRTRSENDSQHGQLVRLDYEAYGSMAQQQLIRLAGDARERWSLARVAVLHRVGTVAIGESSVVIVVASAHRAEAFEACRWLIDSIKKDVPIWKKDVFEDGYVRWVDPTGSSQPTSC